MADTINKYLVFDDDGAMTCDKLEDARTLWAQTTDEVDGNIVNPAQVWHVTDDCPARPMHDDFIDQAQDAVDAAYVAEFGGYNPEYAFEEARGN